MINIMRIKAPKEDQIKPIVDGVIAHGESLVGSNKPSKYAFHLQLDKKLIGGVVGYRQYDRFYLTHIWVTEDYRNKGYGSHLLRTTEDELKKVDCNSVLLETLNKDAINFYKKHGYSVISEIPEYVKGFDLVHFLKAI